MSKEYVSEVLDVLGKELYDRDLTISSLKYRVETLEQEKRKLEEEVSYLSNKLVKTNE